MKILEIVVCAENTREDELDKLYENPEGYFEFYCPDSDLTYILKEREET